MKLYEGLFIFPPDATPDLRKSQLKNLEDLIAKFKGQIQQKNELGRKPLGYAIRKYQDGYGMVYDFRMEPSQATEFRKTLELQEDLIKFMVTVKPISKTVEKKPIPAEALKPSAVPAPKMARPSPAQPAGA